ncbi:hypothetical protein DQ384_31445 [Sphaerisporangium album]|uniref:Uncharacterized protein n=1 Tax=Sphaerisporangium album TaxID=509200 RepID=A0A367F693_9ACTN|nr:hypothetical protein [Sphaerisporangium album]RCG25382.1 hypothetical protein DQ384_31445 [Sphaerisporangium album]
MAVQAPSSLSPRTRPAATARRTARNPAGPSMAVTVGQIEAVNSRRSVSCSSRSLAAWSVASSSSGAASPARPSTPKPGVRNSVQGIRSHRSRPSPNATSPSMRTCGNGRPG